MDKESSNSPEEELKDLLKRCPAGTLDAAIDFRLNKNVLK